MQTEATTSATTAEPTWTTGCCPRFDPAPWDEKEVSWSAKPFVREHVRSIMHVPVAMGRSVMRAMKRIQAADASPAHAMMLGDERSAWRSDLYIETTKDVPGAEMVHLSGTFLTKVFEGPFRDARKWEQQMKGFAQARGKAIEHLYFGYTTCPRCAKAYGKNYVVMFARVDSQPPQAAG